MSDDLGNLRKFGPAIAHKSLVDPCPDLLLDRDGDLSVYYAPFEYVETRAKIVIVGITPGAQQMANALRACRDAMTAKLPWTEIAKEAKTAASFSGAMRRNLINLLDHFDIPALAGVDSAETLFESGPSAAHLTSALRYPVFRGGENYNGTPDLLRQPILRRYFETCFADEVRRLPDAVYIPLGPVPGRALAHLVERGLLRDEQVLDGLPHPSSANIERIRYVLGIADRNKLSKKTNAEECDRRSENVRRKVSLLRDRSKSRSEPVADEVTARYRVKVTEANLKNSHIYIRALTHEFRGDSFGANNSREGLGRPIVVEWGAGGTRRYETDIEGRGRFFRNRALHRQFFDDHDVKPGDTVIFEILTPYHVRLIHETD